MSVLVLLGASFNLLHQDQSLAYPNWYLPIHAGALPAIDLPV
jgi:hypothetical protein